MNYTEERERKYAYWLCCIPGIGNRTIQKMLRDNSSAEEIYKGGEILWRQYLTARQLEAIKQAHGEIIPEKAYEELQRKKISFVLEKDAEYPQKLRDIPDAPFALFYQGMLPRENALAVAVIGARDCSEYGRFVASELGKALGNRGVQVISGMARGIDGISQQAALEAGGLSFAVLGSGVDVCYPRENRRLYDRLRGQGGILSTYVPGTEAKPQNFPPRNRIVSGLADALVVIEARSRSGTLITVDMALEQGKDVFVVPGRVTDRLSDGCNRLLKQGAGIFLSPDDFLEEVEQAWKDRSGGFAECRKAENGKVLEAFVPYRVNHLAPELQEVYRALDLQPQPLDKILEKLGGDRTVQQLTVSLMQLCIEGLAVQLTPGYFAYCIQ